MVAAGLLARNAARRGLTRRPWVKTTLSPGSKVVMDYLQAAGLIEPLEALGFHLAGFGCMTCIGASGPLIEEVSAAVREHDLTVVSVLSGNRNFEGRINPDVKMNYLASPPLVVAYALAGTMDIDLVNAPLAHRPATGSPSTWPTCGPPRTTSTRSWANSLTPACSTGPTRESSTATIAGKPSTPRAAPRSPGPRIPPMSADHRTSTTSSRSPVRSPTFVGARVLVKLGDSVTTDHISPAGAITPASDAGRYLADLGVSRRHLNTFASRRGNHEVMIRGAFANVRLRNQVAPGHDRRPHPLLRRTAVRCRPCTKPQ